MEGERIDAGGGRRRGAGRLGLRIAGWTLFLASASAFILGLPAIVLIGLGGIDPRDAANGLVRPGAGTVGFSLEFDEPEYGLVTVRNTGETVARGVDVRVVEDFTWCDAGTLDQEFWLGDLAPGAALPVPYHILHPETPAEIGRLSIWIRSDRRTAFWFGEWSYAY